MIAGAILPSDGRLIDAGQLAHDAGLGLYIDERGDLVCAPQPQPGWVRVAIKIKTPTPPDRAPLSCAA